MKTLLAVSCLLYVVKAETQSGNDTKLITSKDEDCCSTLRMTLKGLPKKIFPEYENLCNLIGFANGHPYWLSVDKKWVLYVSPDEKNWVIGLSENLKTPIDINAWIYTDFTSCPEKEVWTTFWRPDKKAFFNTTGTIKIEIECVEKKLVTLKNGEKLANDGWLNTMTALEVERKINTSSSIADICGRRPWTNVEDYYKLYHNGHPQGFSGVLPYGPDLRRGRGGRIVNGAAANYGEWPWQVFLGDDSLPFFCGGSLLNEEFVITAAHCVKDYGKLNGLRVTVGDYDRESEDETYKSVVRGVQRLKIHQDFNGKLTYKYYEHDVALLKLDSPVSFAPNIIPICVPNQGQDFGGDNGWATGWGRTDEYVAAPDDVEDDVDHILDDYDYDYTIQRETAILREVNIPLKTTKACGKDFQKTLENLNGTEWFAAPWRIKEKFICAKSTTEDLGARDTCFGDSGGPFSVQREDGRFVLAGITSWGEDCRNGGYYTKVSAIVDWINFEMSY